MAAGGSIGRIGLIIETGGDLISNEFSRGSVNNAVQKGLSHAIFSRVSEKGVDATRKVANGGDSKVAESIVQGIVDVWNKIFDKNVIDKK
ncbi:hypothetical protein ACR79S_19325 [Sphingobacterium spiritivorum]|uniref:hypothetical protein n=1 Tax=Sphingobacterium spiritivorum TaxID=258 RepID=UPI003DA20EC1